MKKVLKKFLIVIIMVALMVTLTGCGEEIKKSKDSNSENNKNDIGLNTTDDEDNNSDKSSDDSKTEDEEDEKDEESSSNSSSSIDEEDPENMDFVENAKKQVAMPAKGETIATLHIKNYGDIKVKFFKDVAPKAVENFIQHSKDGYYNGVTFHRVINDFMIQGGDPTATGAGGESIWGEEFEDEFSYTLVPYRGALCMANAGENTNGSQFFIEQAQYDEDTANILQQYGYPESLINAYKTYGGSMHLFLAHTVFGQVIEGMDVVDKIASTKTDENDKPVEDVVIESIDISEF